MVSRRDYEAVPLDDFHQLPTISHPTPNHVKHLLRKKPLAIISLVLASRVFPRVVLVVLLLPIIYILSGGIPPLYSEIHHFEQDLPQHRNPSGDGKYLRFEGTLTGLGFNNILQEQLLLSYIAYASDRSFVFSDYTWSNLPFPYTVHAWALRQTHMPLNALISGPTAGGDMPSIGLTQAALDDAGDDAPPDRRAVHISYFNTICPSNKRVQLSSTARASLSDDSLDGDVLLKIWVDWLKEVAAEPCVVVDFSKKPVFDHLWFSSNRTIATYPLLAATPILKDFKWSSLVQNSVNRNMAGILSTSPSPSSLIPELVAVHIRRGDYESHCKYLAKWSFEYQGMNRSPGIVDRFDPGAYHKGAPSAEDEANKYAYYLEHCMPNIPQVVKRLRDVKAQISQITLNKVYLLSNGERWWLEELWVALREEGWEPVADGLASSQGLQLTREEWYVSGAIDMAIAEQAEIFIGNGFSSLTGNIIMFRVAKGTDIGYNRLL